ncbi:hypothetical protein ACOME3_000756 [Neoechinorhynchus agilis]
MDLDSDLSLYGIEFDGDSSVQKYKEIVDEFGNERSINVFVSLCIGPTKTVINDEVIAKALRKLRTSKIRNEQVIEALPRHKRYSKPKLFDVNLNVLGNNGDSKAFEVGLIEEFNVNYDEESFERCGIEDFTIDDEHQWSKFK